MIRGLNIIATRSEGLSRFLGAYARLAKLPRPRFDPVDVEAWVARVVELEHRVPVIVAAWRAAADIAVTPINSINC